MRLPRVGTILAGAFVLFLLVATAFPALLETPDPNQIAPSEAFAGAVARALVRHRRVRAATSTAASSTAPSTRCSSASTATAIGLALGLVLGVLAGLGGRFVDFGVNRLVEVLFAFPGLLLALLVIVVYGPGP